VRRHFSNGDKNEIHGINNRTAYWAERMRLMQHWAERIDGLLDVEPAISRSATLVCFRFDPRQRGVIFVHAVEVHHGLASHLVGSDPLLCDQFISLSLSEFAIAATVLELDEPTPLVVVIVNHVSCMCFDDLRHNRIKPR
jgi:hypothetical protein